MRMIDQIRFYSTLRYQYGKCIIIFSSEKVWSRKGGESSNPEFVGPFFGVKEFSISNFFLRNICHFEANLACKIDFKNISLTSPEMKGGRGPQARVQTFGGRT